MKIIITIEDTENDDVIVNEARSGLFCQWLSWLCTGGAKSIIYELQKVWDFCSIRDSLRCVKGLSDTLVRLGV